MATRRTPQELRKMRARERAIEWALFAAAASSVAVTIAIVAVLLYESLGFFAHVPLGTFLTDTMWTPLFADPRYGVLPLLGGTLLSTFVAMLVAGPLGLTAAIYLSEFASSRVREVVKPTLELLSGVPTVVYGFFALLFVTPALQAIIPGLPGFNVLSAGIVMGIMIIPYIASLSEDAMRAVPNGLRDGSLALGATRLETALRVVLPSAFSGVASAFVLGISRAVGETMVVAIAAGQQPNLTIDPREPAATITAYIVQVALGDLPHGSVGYQTIFAVGLVLLLMTLFFNVAAFWLRAKFREAY
ncbi:MAG TPA: phosphate ABC transporter permease subunit PstC [Beijerinckiaceae bacterium]|nr:phosphate ABC transporter permease subunit PstC [Beijerinckiaceae bacterium]